MLEKTIENYFKTKTESNGGLCIKLTGFVGIPDRLILLPGGRMFFVEFKQKGKKPRKIQSFIHDKLRSLGFRVYVIDNKDKIEEVCGEWNLDLTNTKKKQLTR
nr:VRR-NUC domain-containing protein [Candidatus Arthromitus sp. SFB-mouse-NL]